MKELKYELENSTEGLIERYIVTLDSGEVISYEKKLDNGDMVTIFNDRLSDAINEIKRRK